MKKILLITLTVFLLVSAIGITYKSMGILQKPDLTCDTCDVLEVCSGTCSGIPVRAKNVTIAVDVVVWVLFATSFFFSFRKRGDGSVDDTSK